ncbi:hypothetical protein [Pseudomonas sp. 2FE]|uniref:hypothetical protein n=1 Tax=Pseudomonas sp. 2FE TaxID=2502190 RepID=UPI0010F74914|nr:hypothetical protein [Pseudomonas sp. 2FE]
MPRLLVPPQARRALLLVVPVDISVWALGGFYLSLGPALARTVTGQTAPVIGGLPVFALTCSGAIGIMLMRTCSAIPALIAVARRPRRAEAVASRS